MTIKLSEPITALSIQDLESFVRRIVQEEMHPPVPHPYLLGVADNDHWQTYLANFIDQPSSPSPREMLRTERDQ